MGGSTESVNEHTRDLDLRPTEAIVAALLDEERRVPDAVAAVAGQIARAVEAVVSSLRAGGRLHSFGAGTSGRLAALDASELAPTFGLSDGSVVVHLAGDGAPDARGREAAEDDEAAGRAAAGVLGPLDVALGVSASGATPYVRGALVAAHRARVTTVLVSCSPDCPLGREVDVHVAPDTGAEVLAGSTRLKAGTATKLVLNAISTTAMIRLGRTYGNLMVGLDPTNAKLQGRARRILREATGLGEEEARELLAAAGGEVPTALVMALAGVGAGRARAALADGDGSVRRALTRLLAR